MHRTTTSFTVLALTALAHAGPLHASAETTRLPIDEIAGQVRGVLPAEGVLALDVAGRAYQLTPTVSKTVPVTGANVVRGGLLDEPGSFVLSEVDGFVSGAIWTEDGAVEFRPAGGDGLVEVIDIASADLPGCLTDHLAENGPLARPRIDDANGTGLATRGDEPDQVVRVFVGVTEDAQSQLGGPAGALSLVTAAIESTNNAFGNSLMTLGDLGVVGATIELAGTATVDGAGLGASGLLTAISNPSDGIMDELHTLRDATRADLVALISRSGIGACGIAYYAINNPSLGFSVTAYSCAVGNLTFAHELGHNFGAAHDADNAGSGNAPYGFGWRWNTTGGSLRRSVMAYSPGSRRPHFSNPEVTNGGGVTGDTASADNARLIGETFPSVASFRIGSINSADDCDGNGFADAVEILIDPALDSDASGTLDSCDLAQGLLEDCNGDGIADIGQARPRVALGPSPIALHGFPPNQADFGDPAEAVDDVVLVLEADVGLSGSDRYIDVLINGDPIGRFWQDDGVDCGNGPVEATVDRDTWNSLERPIIVTLQRPPAVSFTGCSDNVLTVSVEYSGVNREFDADADGVIDECDPGCSLADVAEPFGVLDLTDLSTFVAAFTAGDLAADVAAPFGVLDLTDIATFAGSFADGCP